ncbi:MAG: hypothetical protein ACRDOF_00990 [Gaiellaceae bacterium]
MTSITLTPPLVRARALEAGRGCGTPGCSCCATTSLATAPNVVTIALLVAQVICAAAGQMVGKSCFFLGGRTVLTRWTRAETRRRSRSSGRLRRLVARATRQRLVAAVTVFFSAVTGLPPFALVSALAGAWRIRLSSFLVLGLAGRSARFAAVLLVPQVPAW